MGPDGPVAERFGPAVELSVVQRARPLRIRACSGSMSRLVTATTIVTGTLLRPTCATAWGTSSSARKTAREGGLIRDHRSDRNTDITSTKRRARRHGTGSDNSSPARARTAVVRGARHPAERRERTTADEKRPSHGTAGGAYFKFVPTTLYDPPTADRGPLHSPFTPVRSTGCGSGSGAGTPTTGRAPSRPTGCPVPAATDPDLRAQSARSS